MGEPDWKDGQCYSSYGEFFPPDELTGYMVSKWYRSAVRQCDGCPIIAECLQYRMETEDAGNGHRSGVWGGTTPTQRAKLYPQWKGTKWLPHQKRDAPSEKNSGTSPTSGLEGEKQSPRSKGRPSSSQETPDNPSLNDPC